MRRLCEDAEQVEDHLKLQLDRAEDERLDAMFTEVETFANGGCKD
jgi:hypothetical protein